MSEIINRAHYDAAERKFTFERIQDVEDILENNKRLQNTPQSRDTIWRETSCVPNVIIEKWLHEEWARGNTELKFLGKGFAEFMKRKIDDPDNRAWRTDNPSNPFYVGWRK